MNELRAAAGELFGSASSDREPAPTRPDVSDVRFYTDSDHLHDIAAEIRTLRESAASQQRRTGAEVAAINGDTTLSSEGQRRALQTLNGSDTEAMKGLRQQEIDLLDGEAAKLETRLDGYIGYLSSDIIAFRDAQDRAETLESSERALTIMERALRTNDRTLAHAVYRRAIEAGWREVITPFDRANPEAAEMTKDLHTIRKLRAEGGFGRVVAYMPVSR